MTSESDNTGRRPPTIELAATEVATSAAEPAAGPAESADTRAAEEAPASSNASSPTGGNQQTSSASSGRLKLHITGALIGAVIMAAALAALWLTDLIPARDGTAGHTLASNTSAPATLSPTPPPNQAPSQAQSQTPDLSARLDKIERAIEAQRTEPALGNRIGGVEAQAKSLGNDVAALQRRLDEIAASGQSAAKQADTALNAAEAAKSASEAANKMEVQRGDLDAVASRIMALESAVKGLAAATAPVDRAARFTIAAEALRAAVERGTPYQAELAALGALGVDQKATAPLEPFAASGVPSTAALAHELDALTPALQQASEPGSGDATFLGRLKANAEKLVRLTPAGAPAGNDPAAVLARIRFDAAHGDIAAALAAIDALPDSAKSLAAAWRKKAAACEAALAASRQIASDALTALAKPPAR
ncbi:MAG TPA: mitofilin family membrane protein [Xanthobacteraceae bacterium]|nr:mitofilin family membrane protein [Xanthobacteraceae bacterium]